jgi:hypothetical protein
MAVQTGTTDVERNRTEIYAQYDLDQVSYRKCLDEAVATLDDGISDALTIVEALLTQCALERSIFIHSVRRRLDFEAGTKGEWLTEIKSAVEGWDSVQEITLEWRPELIAKVLERRANQRAR